jgi:putative oxidoreductase
MTHPSVSQPETTQLLVAPGRIDLVRQLIDDLLRRFSLPLLRISLGLVFIWFGALKVADVTPAHELVAGTIPFLDAGWLVPALGWFEIAVGGMLVSGYLLGWVCAAMVAHLGGTFLTVVMQPEVLFQHGNPFMLTMEGEFVAKNLVLMTAAVVIAAWARRVPGRGARSVPAEGNQPTPGR